MREQIEVGYVRFDAVSVPRVLGALRAPSPFLSPLAFPFSLPIFSVCGCVCVCVCVRVCVCLAVFVRRVRCGQEVGGDRIRMSLFVVLCCVCIPRPTVQKPRPPVL